MKFEAFIEQLSTQFVHTLNTRLDNLYSQQKENTDQALIQEEIDTLQFRIKHQIPWTLHLVGGAIRDELLQEEVKKEMIMERLQIKPDPLRLEKLEQALSSFEPDDHDYLISGLDEKEFVTMFPDARAVGVGFPVYLLTIDGDSETQIAFARQEKHFGPKHTDVAFQFNPFITPEMDLRRRDFRMNAIAKDMRTGEIFDPYNGRLDIQNRVISQVSEAFSEDPERVYRGARFMSKLSVLGFRINERTKRSMSQLSTLLPHLHSNRIVKELTKVFDTHTPSVFFRTLQDIPGQDGDSLLSVHFKEMANLVGTEQNPKYHPEGDAFEHTLLVIDAAAYLATLHKLSKERRNLSIYTASHHDLGKALSPARWAADPIKNPFWSHFGHDRDGVWLSKTLSERLGVPNDWKEAAMFGCLQHMKMHSLNTFSFKKIVHLIEGIDDPIALSKHRLATQKKRLAAGIVNQKKVDLAENELAIITEKHAGTEEQRLVHSLLIQGARRNKLGVEGLAFLAQCDVKGKGDLNKKHPYADDFIRYASLTGSVRIQPSELPIDIQGPLISTYKKKLQEQTLLAN